MNDPLKDQLVYEQSLPLKWEAVDIEARSFSVVDINSSNENFLRMLLSLDDTKKEYDDSSEHAQEFQRIDAKLNVLLDWLGKWVTETQGVPDEVEIKLSESGIALSLSTEVDVGATLLFHVHLSRSYPQALYLPCKVLSVENTSDGSAITAEFLGLTIDVCNLIEKFIFREHRRNIAAHKRLNQPEK